jgi:hypothetical protein
VGGGVESTDPALKWGDKSLPSRWTLGKNGRIQEQVPAKLERSNHKKDVALEILTDPLLR